EKGPRVKAREEADGYEITDEQYSLGFDAHKDGALIDVLTDSPAARSGLAPGMKLVAVDGRRYSRKVLEDALRLGKGSGQPVALPRSPRSRPSSSGSRSAAATPGKGGPPRPGGRGRGGRGEPG